MSFWILKKGHKNPLDLENIGHKMSSGSSRQQDIRCPLDLFLKKEKEEDTKSSSGSSKKGHKMSLDLFLTSQQRFPFTGYKFTRT